MKIFTRLFITHAAIGVVSVVFFSVIFYFLLQKALIERTVAQLSSINVLKKNQIESYFNSTKETLEFQATRLINAPLNIGGQCPENIKTLLDVYHFRSIIVTDNSFNATFSCAKDSLLLAFIEQHHATSSFRITDEAVTGTEKTALFYTVPFKGGYLFVQDRFDKIQLILNEVAGMGTTGESYVVGKNNEMRSLSRLQTGEQSIVVNTTAVADAHKNHANGGIINDYRHIKVVSFYRPLVISGISWVLISEIDFDEAMKPVNAWRNVIIGVTLMLALLVLIVTLFISKAIANPILYLREMITSVTKGVAPVNDIGNYRISELQQIAGSIKNLVEWLRSTTEFANETGVGNFEAPFTTLSKDDALGIALIAMRDKLKLLNATQVRLVREKASAMLEGQEIERRRVVRELHDGVGQLLTAVRLQVDLLEPAQPAKNEILNLIDETTTEVKRISYNLMPNALVDFGLEAALRGLCEKIRKYIPVQVEFQYVREHSHDINFDVSIAVFRVIQEGFNNIIKHAGASLVQLHFVENKDDLYFVLKDNGSGFDFETNQGGEGFGLRSMRERIELLNGTLEIHSSFENGTVLEAFIPLKK